jgi:uncharacterized Zn finger protein
VLSIEETKQGISARVQGSQRTPYKVTIRIAPLTDAQWDKVIDTLAEQAIFSAQLLAGEMPADIEDAFRSAGVSLFPVTRGDLETDCSCPDWANPCKHVAATHYILGEQFDEDPFLLFRLRGRTQEQIMQALRLRRAGQELVEDEIEEEEDIFTPLEETLDNFWEMTGSLEGFTVSIREPSIEVPLLKRLGDPSFVAPPGLQSLLLPAYRAISRAAQETAYADSQPEESKP